MSLIWVAALVPPLFILQQVLKPSWAAGTSWQWLRYLGPVSLLSLLWVYVVSRYVPEPYLDEIFHIPQAQRYWLGKFYEWDDKLTTPPGLYVYSLFAFFVSGARSMKTALCSAADLRATNAVALLILGYLALLCRHAIEQLFRPRSELARSIDRDFSNFALYTALNVCLFPLLFFFSGLYYTDVVSTAAVLAAFLNHLGRNHVITTGGAPSVADDVSTVLIGIVTLFMRQTNVFWTVVFMGGLEAVHAVKTLKPPAAGASSLRQGSLLENLKHFLWRSSVGDVQDLSLADAWLEDWICTAVSLLIAGLSNPLLVLRRIWPYLAILASFAGFVVWNGGVVLGDKTNHVATIHLAQMLYIWPLFAFFSLPLLFPYMVTVLDHLWALLSPQAAYKKSTKSTVKVSSAGSGRTLASKALNALYLLGTVLLSFAIVHFNTIVHPFTLADNRHYMFYVFRYTIRRAGWVRYALVPLYTTCRWLTWGLLSGGNAVHTDRTTKEKGSAAQGQKAALGGEITVPTSTGIIFLLATSLSLITAPLVEPRYFIIPWVIWRLFVPSWHAGRGVEGGMIRAAEKSHNAAVQENLRCAREYDIRLGMETLWFVLVNLGTMAVFLMKPYVWKAEDGTVLDEGRLQRFMW